MTATSFRRDANVWPSHDLLRVLLDPSIVKVLSIDGGGIRGVMVASFLAAAERILGEKTGRKHGYRTAFLYDLIAGTSTGAIIAAYLTTPSAKHLDSPAHSALSLVRLYLDHARTIFPEGLLRTMVRPARAVVAPKHPSRGLEHLVAEKLRDAKLSDSVTPIVVPSFDQLSWEDAVFKTTKAESGLDWFLRDVAIASAAAPTYFRSHRATDTEGILSGQFVDGGIWANNPALCAHVEALEMFPGKKIAIISVGTGRRRPKGSLGPRSGGLLQWAPVLAELFMTSGERGIDHQIRAYCKALGHDYYRLQVDVPEEADMDRTDDGILKLLVDMGEELAARSLAIGGR